MMKKTIKWVLMTVTLFILFASIVTVSLMNISTNETETKTYMTHDYSKDVSNYPWELTPDRTLILPYGSLKNHRYVFPNIAFDSLCRHHGSPLYKKPVRVLSVTNYSFASFNLYEIGLTLHYSFYTVVSDNGMFVLMSKENLSYLCLYLEVFIFYEDAETFYDTMLSISDFTIEGDVPDDFLVLKEVYVVVEK